MANIKRGKKKNKQNIAKNKEPNNATATALALEKPVNCHYIPQWILRRFSTQECSKDGWQKKDDMEVYYYCVKSGTLTNRRIKEVYAEGDLYKDPSNSLDVGKAIEIEREQSKLEYSASITVKFIHRAIEDRDIMNNGGEGSTARPAHLNIKRKHLDLLKKFLFIMTFHQPSASTACFDPDKPYNFNARRWIKAYQARYNLLDGPKHIWLHILRYYLVTPHHEIHETGRIVNENFFLDSIQNGTLPDDDSERGEPSPSAEIDPDLDDWKCLKYYLHTWMFLAIWEAARGEQFVMSSEPFGVFEGGTISSGRLHKFFVVSPRMILVFYHPGLTDQENANNVVNSTNPWKLALVDSRTSILATAPHKEAEVKYISDQPPPSQSLFSGHPGVFAPSPADDFKFEICPLSPKDTHTVNGIILQNLSENSAVTFGSRDAALRTLTQFNLNPAFNPANKQGVQSLIRHLSPVGSVQTVRERYFASLTPSNVRGWATNLELYRLLQEGTDADCICFRRWKELYRPLWLEDKPPHSPYRPAKLVSTMDDILAQNTFIAISELMESFGPDLREEPIFGDQMIIAFLDDLVKYNRDQLEVIEEVVFGLKAGCGRHGIMEYIDEPCGTEGAVTSPEPKDKEHLSGSTVEPADNSSAADLNSAMTTPTTTGHSMGNPEAIQQGPSTPDQIPILDINLAMLLENHSMGNPEAIQQGPSTPDQIPILDINLAMLLENQLASICLLIFFVFRHCVFLVVEILVIAFDSAWVRGGAVYWSMAGDRFPLFNRSVMSQGVISSGGYYRWFWLLIGSWVYVSVVLQILFLIFEWLGPAGVFMLFFFAMQ